jgi:hypothetical protein
MGYKLSKRSKERLVGVDTILVAIIEDSIIDSPYDFGIPKYGGLRTAEEQNKLYKDRKSKCDGYEILSYHQSGKAFDIFGYVDGKATWDKSILTSIARHIQSVALDCYGVELRWGGDWVNFKDLPHFEWRE